MNIKTIIMESLFDDVKNMQADLYQIQKEYYGPHDMLPKSKKYISRSKLSGDAHIEGVNDALNLTRATLSKKIGTSYQPYVQLGNPNFYENIQNPVTITLTNVDDNNDKKIFPSICQASKAIKKSHQSIDRYIKNKTTIFYMDEYWYLTRPEPILSNHKQKLKNIMEFLQKIIYEKNIILSELTRFFPILRPELIDLAFKNGIKDPKNINNKILYYELGLPYVSSKHKGNINKKPVKILFTAVEDGEEIEFKSMEQAAAALGKKSGTSIKYSIRNKQIVWYNDKYWSVKKK